MKAFFLLFLLFFLSACGDDFKRSIPRVTLGDKDTDVNSGTALQRNSLVKSVKCADGHFDIFSPSGNQSLKVGEAVSIKGTIRAADSCFKKPVSFSCEGVVQIGVNRVFSCHTGTVSTSYSSFSVPQSKVDILNPLKTVPSESRPDHFSPRLSPPSSGDSTSFNRTAFESRPGHFSPRSYPSSSRGFAKSSASLMQGSSVHTYNNGTGAAVFLTYQNPNVAGFICKHQFACSESQ